MVYNFTLLIKKKKKTKKVPYYEFVLFETLSFIYLFLFVITVFIVR